MPVNAVKASQIIWTEPNRAKTPPLNIESRGERFSTLTGVWWIDEFKFVVNHRNGLRIALFDIRAGAKPLAITSIPHLSDDIAARRLDENTWEVAVSGCWDKAYSTYLLAIHGPEVTFALKETRQHPDRSFCHGVYYDGEGRLCLAFHTGKNPRIEMANRTWTLPQPWGPRDLCHDSNDGIYYAVAVSKNPQLVAYEQTSTSVWSLKANADQWDLVTVIDDMHSDACQIYQGRLWLPDQKGDRVLGVCLKKEKPPLVIKGKCFDFPHGLAISEKGMLAVTNYGNSSITLVDIHH